MTFAVALDVRAELGECPIWSAEEQALYFVDIKGRALHRFEPRAGKHARDPDARGDRLHRFQERRRLHRRLSLRPVAARCQGGDGLRSSPTIPRTRRQADSTTDASIRRGVSRGNDRRAERRRQARISIAMTARSRRAGGRSSHVERRRVLAGRAHALSCRYADLHDLALCLRSRNRRGDGPTPCSRGSRRRKAIAAGPTARLWMRKAATGRRCSRVAGFSATRPMDSFSPNFRSGPLPHDGCLRRARSEDPVCDLGANGPSRRRTRSPATFGQPVFHAGRGARPARTSFRSCRLTHEVPMPSTIKQFSIVPSRGAPW